MLKHVCLTAAVMAVVAGPAFAAGTCGTQPFAPEFKTASELNAMPVDAARKTVLDSYHNVKTYQASLKSYRDCLLQLTKTDEDDIAAAKAKADQSTIDAINQRIAARQADYDKTIDAEQKVATDFNTLHTAHCTRDTDAKICPQPKKK